MAADAAAAASVPLEDEIDVDSIDSPYKIAADQSNAIRVQSWLREERQRSDPAFVVRSSIIILALILTLVIGLRAPA